jgi:hypothetical protein
MDFRFSINSVPNSSIQDLEIDRLSIDGLSMEGNCCNTPLKHNYEGGDRRQSKSQFSNLPP